MNFRSFQGQIRLKDGILRLYFMNYLLLIELEVLIQEAFEQFQLDIFDQEAFVKIHSVQPLILLPFSTKH